MHDMSDYTRNLARKGTPNLYLAANFLEPDDKFRAFLASYAAMRLVDDLTDDNRALGDLPETTKLHIIEELDRFARMFIEKEIDDTLPYANELKFAMVHFDLPGWPFTSLAEAMKFDLHNDRFDTFETFLQYSEGAAVAPASIFMYLASCQYDERGQVTLPGFDIRDAARPLAVFSYLVHILRDFKKDFTAGLRPLIYLDLESSDMFYIREQDMAETVATGEQSYKFTKMVQWYFNRVTRFQVESEHMLADIADKLPEDGAFALNFIYTLYSANAARIADNRYNLVKQDLNLTIEDIESAARMACRRTGVSPANLEERLKAILTEAPAAQISFPR